VADNSATAQTRIGAAQGIEQRVESRVLAVVIGHRVLALELDPNGKIIAGPASFVARLTGVPGARMKRHVLHAAAVPSDQDVRGHPAVHCAEIGMRIRRQAAGKEPVNPRPSELARRQADAMNKDKIRLDLRWSCVEMRRKYLSCADKQSGRVLDLPV